MPLFVNLYKYTDDPDARTQIRPEHRHYLDGLGSRLLLSGPTDANGAVMVFDAESAAEVTGLLDDDPFVRAGLVATREVVGWDLVVGSRMRALTNS